MYTTIQMQCNLFTKQNLCNHINPQGALLHRNHLLYTFDTELSGTTIAYYS